MKQKQTQNNGGFTLIEVMVSILLLVVIIAGASASMYQTGAAIQRQQNKREAIFEVNTFLERLLNTTYAELVALDGTTDSGSVTINGNTMAYEVSVGHQLDANGDSCMEVVVDIDHLGSQDDVVLTVRRYQYGLSKASIFQE